MQHETEKLIYDIIVTNTKPQHALSASETIFHAFEVPLDYDGQDIMRPHHIEEHIQRFPEGQFVAVMRRAGRPDVAIGMAVTMLTNHAPSMKAHRWEDMLGSMGLANHNPYGRWLYGAEMAVRPEYRKFGIGSALYEARFDLVRRLGLRGWYAVGCLMGYQRYKDLMSVREYGERVITGELYDPTVTMQMNRGFKPLCVVEDYLDDEPCAGAGVLIVWDNPDF